MIGHFDWRTGNLGFDEDRVVAIYDWDSLFAAPEPVIVGATAAQFCIDFSAGEDDPVPTVAEMLEFVHCYEYARGAPFSADERSQLDAANLAQIAYGARCQHSDVMLHPGLSGTAHSHWLRLLHERGESTLEWR